MRVVLVGHRGVGKTSLLYRWKDIYAEEGVFYDLDREIELKIGKSISQIFSTVGEAGFRDLEAETFQKLLKTPAPHLIIAVGAGFELNRIPPTMTVLWIRRDTDEEGRIFTNRPRLEPLVNPLEEYRRRFEGRELKFRSRADRVYTVPEGLQASDPLEESFLLNRPVSLKALLTLMPRHLRAAPNYQDVQYEIRDDLLSVAEQEKALSLFPPESLLFSKRTDGPAIPDFVTSRQIALDWDLRQPLPDGVQASVVSTHEKNFSQALQILRPYEGTKLHLKLCPLVQDWDDLWKGYEWFQEDPANRSFLPRSLDGRWAWFRLRLKGQQRLNFVREDQGSSQDQPTIWDWLSCPSPVKNFAAVLGDPIRHSFSPAYHKNFFAKLNMPFLKVRLEKPNWEKAFAILERLGLSAAAVTSPLKQEAGSRVGLAALNTLVKTPSGWKGINTDLAGAQALLEEFRNESLVVWGGGGVLDSLRASLSQASFYSAQSGTPRQGASEVSNPRVLVWAAPDGSLTRIPQGWKPEIVVDLNYRQNSEGLWFAQQVGARYVSGLKMFQVQANEQQKFWSTFKFTPS
ncbi:MAG: shikimate kinase [Bdellovibrionales bacterium]